ncbi:hypothetical protein REH65_07490 [Saccharopolyspora sp. ID03-671]|uniref:hypothetical protein n=1 Tax=Saccharopolyspora sp. ID03-671 TaxID=3073066 RepID=UPI00324828A7
MATAQELMEAQFARFAALDPQLPHDQFVPSDAEPVAARTPEGYGVAGLVTHTSNPAGSARGLWQAGEAFELFPIVGEHPRSGLDALLGAWREWLAARDDPGSNSSAMVVWPSRDVQGTRALLDHGFLPLSVLAVRSPVPVADTELSLVP